MDHPSHRPLHARALTMFLLVSQGLLLLAAIASAQDAPAPAESAAPTAPAPAPIPATASAESAPAAPAPAIVAPLPAPAPAAVAVSAGTEDEDENDDQAQGFGAFLIGAGLFDLSSLNDRLAANGYDKVDGAMTLIGGEGHAVLASGFVIGGRGAAILGPSGDGPGSLRTHFNGGFGLFDLGFALVHTRSVLFTVLGGIGGYGLGLSIGDDSGTTFNDALKHPKRGTSLSRGGFLTGLVLGFDGQVPLGKPEKNRQGFFTLGARIGGLYGPSLGDWTLPEGADASGGPADSMAGVYAMLMIGFGGGPAEQTAHR